MFSTCVFVCGFLPLKTRTESLEGPRDCRRQKTLQAGRRFGQVPSCHPTSVAASLPDQYQTRRPNIFLLGPYRFGLQTSECYCLVHMKGHTNYCTHLTGLLGELNEIIHPQRNTRPMTQPFFHAVPNKSHPLQLSGI